MATSKPKLPVIEYYWMWVSPGASRGRWEIFVRILGADGKQVGEVKNAGQAKHDARRSVDALAGALCLDPGFEKGYVKDMVAAKLMRERGPGPKPRDA